MWFSGRRKKIQALVITTFSNTLLCNKAFPRPIKAPQCLQVLCEGYRQHLIIWAKVPIHTLRMESIKELHPIPLFQNEPRLLVNSRHTLQVYFFSGNIWFL